MGIDASLYPITTLKKRENSMTTYDLYMIFSDDNNPILRKAG